MAGKDLDIVVMAAGMGTRMRSQRPKVLHRLAGRSLLQHVLAAAAALGPRRIVVVTGFGAESVEASVQPSPELAFVRQQPQLGTGHAVQQAVPLLGDDGYVLILNGDVPLIEAATARELVDAARRSGGLALLTVTLDDASGYGRVVRDPGAPRGRIVRIVEERDATAEERAIREIYTGVMCAPSAALKRWLARLTNENAQAEYYLTDAVAAAVADGTPVADSRPRDVLEVQGVNSAAQLAALERAVQRREAERLMEAGVRLADPARFDVRGTLECGRDVEIDVGCVFEGHVVLGDEVAVGAHCVIRNAAIESGARIAPCTHVDGGAGRVRVGPGATVGPFARLRAGADLGPDVHVGNFVEIKNSTLGAGAKANHLAYLGDATVGERVNYGAGSITANYDGANKHRTIIEADAHIGSNCVLVAPVTVGAGATIGGGSTISRDAPAGQLTVARARQATLPGWKRPTKQR
ncbi:MAG TPA: bifunctional UDP-N-acetylglucosamine diphosphorylase/glucosamine-1-phosphate N-acetyltransferase GlmU [Caldimonas sp.]|nr:bifunctional UDP-N-acetylglucosamine diphosphorylase/glucosamine-1-phosphate N-acetyltransferase GlmU [Caldimonas sp.]